MMYSITDIISKLMELEGVISIFLLVFLLTLLVILTFYLVGLWKFFEKAGRKGWEAIIPFYNCWVMVKIAGLAWWYALIIILDSIINKGSLDTILSLGAIVANFFTYYNISKRLHKDMGFAILMTIFPFIMIPLIGLSNNYQFDSSVPVSENGPIGEENTNYSSNHETGTNENHHSDDNTSEKHFCSHCGAPLESDAKYCGNCGREIK